MARSILAIVLGFVLIAACAVGVDAAHRALDPAAFGPGGRVDDPLTLAVMLGYVTVIAAAGCYLTARLAPSRPMRHALVLGALGLAFNVAGTIAMWETAPAWYHGLALALVMPTAWLGGWLRERELRARPVVAAAP